MWSPLFVLYVSVTTFYRQSVVRRYPSSVAAVFGKEENVNEQKTVTLSDPEWRMVLLCL